MRLSAVALASFIGKGLASAPKPTAATDTINNRRKKRYRSFQRLPSTFEWRSTASGGSRYRRRANSVLKNDHNAETTKSFEVCHLSPRPKGISEDTDLDTGILEQIRKIARGGCSSEEDICILPNVIGYDVHSSFAVGNEHGGGDDYYSTAMGICYPQEYMHESYVQNRIPDWGNDKNDRRLPSLQRFSRKSGRSAPIQNLLRQTITKEESYMLTCEDECSIFERPNIAKILAELGSKAARRSLFGIETVSSFSKDSSGSKTEDSSDSKLEDTSDSIMVHSSNATDDFLSSTVYDEYIDDGYYDYDLPEANEEPTSHPLYSLISQCLFSYNMIVTHGFFDYPSRCPFDVHIPFNCWNMTGVTDFDGAFAREQTFNQPIGCWDTSAVTSMTDVFYYASSFNQPLEMWDTSGVTDMSRMFYIAGAFNQPIGRWNTSSLMDTTKMFGVANQFDQPIDFWDMSRVETMDNMFFAAMNFDRPLFSWNTSSVRALTCTFCIAISFNHPVSTWDVSNVESLAYTFKNAMVFNQPLNSWNVSNVKTLHSTFYGASRFDQPLHSWDVSKVETMYETFSGALVFNQPLNGNNFNIDSWNVSSVTTMESMFRTAASFNQCLGTWFASLALNEYANENSTLNMFQRSACPVHRKKDIGEGEGDDEWGEPDPDNAEKYQSENVRIVYDEGTPPFDRGPWCQDSRHECYAPQALMLSTMRTELAREQEKEKHSKSYKQEEEKHSKSYKQYKSDKKDKSYKSDKKKKDDKSDKKKYKRNRNLENKLK